MRIGFVLLLPCLLAGQDLAGNFDRMVVEINRNRFDRALQELFPVQSLLRDKTEGKYPPLDAGMRSRMRSMGSPTAVLSAVALLRSQIASENFEEANVQALFAGLGLSALWAEMPPYWKLNFAKEDLAAAPPAEQSAAKKKLGYAAIDAKEWALALETAKDLARQEGAIRHSALTIRGLAELGTGNPAAAERTLLESMRNQASLEMRDGGPNFRLAEELLQRGRKEIIDRFLALVAASSWKDSSKAGEWQKDLAAGREIDFGRWNGMN